MATVRSIELTDELSKGDLEDVSQDVQRMLRRARATKRGRMHLKASVERLGRLLRQQTVTNDEVTVADLIDVVRNHEEEAFQSAQPFVSFFYSDGLLPGEVDENALLLFVMNSAIDNGYVTVS